MQGREFKDLVYEQFAYIAQAFSAPKRLEIIDVLAQGERDVDTLSRRVNMSTANTSRHLQVLKTVRLVEVRKEGVRHIYRLADREVLQCWLNLQTLAEHRSAEIAEVARLFFTERDTMQPISAEELQERARTSEVIILDVRPYEEYQSEHIQGAISVPLEELRSRIDELPLDREVVAYCRGPYCVMAAEAIQILRNAGFRAARLRDGLPNWQEAGYPVETG